MVLDNLEVRHKAFGDGVIISASGQYFTVKFSSCEKVFVYPDIFEKFLTLGDGTVSEDILRDIEASKAAKQVILDKKNEENLRAMTRGIVIPGKEFTGNESEDEESKFKNEAEDI